MDVLSAMATSPAIPMVGLVDASDQGASFLDALMGNLSAAMPSPEEAIAAPSTAALPTAAALASHPLPAPAPPSPPQPAAMPLPVPMQFAISQTPSPSPSPSPEAPADAALASLMEAAPPAPHDAAPPGIPVTVNIPHVRPPSLVEGSMPLMAADAPPEVTAPLFAGFDAPPPVDVVMSEGSSREPQAADAPQDAALPMPAITTAPPLMLPLPPTALPQTVAWAPVVAAMPSGIQPTMPVPAESAAAPATAEEAPAGPPVPLDALPAAPSVGEPVAMPAKPPAFVATPRGLPVQDEPPDAEAIPLLPESRPATPVPTPVTAAPTLPERPMPPAPTPLWHPEFHAIQPVDAMGQFTMPNAPISAGMEDAAPRPSPTRQIAPIAIALAFTPGASNGFHLTLDPAELGRVEIRVKREGDNHSVQVMAERPETLALLQRDRQELDRSLADAGLRVESKGIDFSLGHAASQSGQQGDAPRGQVRRRDARGLALAEPEPAPSRAPRGLLDLNI